MAAVEATSPSDAGATPESTPVPESTPPPMTAYTPPPEPPPMSAYTPPATPPATDWGTTPAAPAPPATDWAAASPAPTPPATDWAVPAASPTPPAGTPVQSMPETQAWAQAPATRISLRRRTRHSPRRNRGWPQQPQPYQQPQAYAPPPAYPAQQPYQQPAAYPPQQAWQQPGQPAQPSGWVQPQGEYWAQPGSGGVWAYKTSVLAILASVWLLLVGLISLLGGLVAIGFGSDRFRNFLADNATTATADQIDAVVKAVGIVGGFFLVCGILILLSTIGIWLHKTWGRVIGIIFSVLGLLISLPFLAAGSSTTTLSDGRIATANLAPIGIVFVVLWGLTLLFLIISGGHFHKHRVG